MSPPPAEGRPVPSTRAELLELQHAHIVETEQELFSARRALAGGAWLALVAFVFIIGAANVSSSTEAAGGAKSAYLVIFVLIFAVAVWRLVRHARHGHRLRTDLGRWVECDRTPESRALPTGDPPRELATIHDARDRADLDAVIKDVELRSQLRILNIRRLVPTFLAMIPGVVGLVLALEGIFGGGSAASGIVLTMTGMLMLVVFVTTSWTAVAEAWRFQQASNRVGLERSLYRTRRALLTGQQTTADPALPSWVRPVAALVFVVVAGVFLVRVTQSSTLATVLTMALVAAVALAASVPVVRRRALHVVPLLAPGAAVLQKPTRWVDLALSPAGLRISASDGASCVVSGDEILAVVPVSLPYPFAPEAVGLITEDEPIVLAGRKVSDVEAIRSLRERLAARSSGAPDS